MEPREYYEPGEGPRERRIAERLGELRDLAQGDGAEENTGQTGGTAEGAPDAETDAGGRDREDPD
jgi:hypothetical protein